MSSFNVARVVAIVLVFAATAVNGATEHAAALLLRLVVVAGCLLLWPRQEARVSWVLLAVPALCLAVVLFGWVHAPNPGIALQAVVSSTLVCFLFLALVVCPVDWNRQALDILIAVGMAHTLWAIGQRLGTPSGRATAGFYNPNDLASFVAPLAILAVSRKHWGHWRWLVAAVLAVGVLATGSRSGVLALAAGLVLAAWASRRRVLVVGVVLVVALVAAISLRERWLGQGDPYAYSRVAIWRASVALGLEASPAGVGLAFYEEAMRQHGVQLEGWVHYPRLANSAHNEVLNAWVELGWLGLLATLAPVVLMAWLITRRQAELGKRAPLANEPAADPPSGPVATDYGPWENGSCWLDAAVLVSLAIPALVSASLHVPPTMFLAAVWAAAVARGRVLQPRAVVLSRGRLACYALGVGLTLAAIPGTATQVLERVAAYQSQRQHPAAAAKAATLAAAMSPWSLGAALFRERLRLADGADPLDVAEQLVTLGDAFAYSPQPLVGVAARPPTRCEPAQSPPLGVDCPPARRGCVP